MLTGFSTVLEKKFQLSVKKTFPTMIMLNLINGAFGCVYFLFLSKFNIEMNSTTFVFSLGYAMMVFNSLLLSVIALSKLTIPVRAIVRLMGSVLGSTMLGGFFFSEEITANSIIAIIFLIAAVIVPYIKNNEVTAEKNSVPVCIWIFITSVIESVYLKFYTENPSSLGANNMFFMTNLICLIICAAGAIMYIIVKGNTERKNILTTLGVKHIANIGFRTAISNICSIISVLVISVMDISVYTVLTSSMGLIVSVMISKFVFSEDLTWKNYVSVALAVVSIILQAL